MPQHYLKFYHDRLLPRPFQFIIQCQHNTGFSEVYRQLLGMKHKGIEVKNIYKIQIVKTPWEIILYYDQQMHN